LDAQAWRCSNHSRYADIRGRMH